MQHVMTVPSDGVVGVDLGHVVKVLAVGFVAEIINPLPSSYRGKKQDFLRAEISKMWSGYFFSCE